MWHVTRSRLLCQSFETKNLEKFPKSWSTARVAAGTITEVVADTFCQVQERATLLMPCIRKMMALIVLLSLPLSGIAQEKTFSQRYDVHVDASKGAARPETMLEAEFTLPEGYKIVRAEGTEKGLKVTKNDGGMDDRYWEVSETPNGVKIKWKLRNGKIAPFTGRDGFIVLQLTGVRATKMSLSPQYFSLRKRLLDQFYFQGRIAAYVDHKVVGGKANFGDQTMYMGMALGVFATEAKILKDSGGKPADAEKYIEQILNAFDELDLKAEEHFGTKKTSLNGFFVRDDLTGPTDERLAKRFKEVESDWQSKDDSSPSGDQIFGMMFGLDCVVRHCENDVLKKQAKAISSRIYDYAKRSFFELKTPNGEATKRGSDMRWLASLLHGLNQSVTGEDLFDKSRYKVAGIERKLNDIGSLWASQATQALIEKSVGKKVNLLVTEVELNSFALHIMLMALAPTDVWPHTAIENVSMKCNHHLAELVYCQTHNTLPRKYQQKDIQDILKLCPEGGPKASLDPKTGWQQDSRWVRSTKIRDANGGSHEYNGLDWLLLHNFLQLVFLGP